VPAVGADGVRACRPDVSRRPRGGARPAAAVAQSDAVGTGRHEVHAVAQRARSQPAGQQEPVTAEIEVAETGVVVTADRHVLPGAVKPQRAADLSALVDAGMTEDADVEVRMENSVADY